MKKMCIIIPFHNPWRWHTDYTNQTAIFLSKHYWVICYLWGDAISLRELIASRKPYVPLTKHGSLWLYRPLFLFPGKRSIAMQYVNMLLNLFVVYIVFSITASIRRHTLIVWFFGIFDPVFLLYPLIFRHTKTVYDCVDLPIHPNKTLDTAIKKTEKRVLSYAWIVTANSKTMAARLMQERPDTHVVPLGFRIEMYHTRASYILPHVRQPIIGYIGAIDYRIDLRILEHLITRNRGWQFALIGPVFSDHLSRRTLARLNAMLSEPNVYHAHISHTFIPDFLSKCDVTIIPYTKDSMFNRYAFPMKTMEYLYSRKRIVATDTIQELYQFAPLVLPASTLSQWNHQIHHALLHPLTPGEQRRARQIASGHTWEKKINTIIRLMEQKYTNTETTNR